MKTSPCLLMSSIVLTASWLRAEGFTPTDVLEYKAGQKTSLKLHIFKPDGMQPSDKRPAIVFFFGGGWTGGSPEQFYPHSAYLASRGMVAISADYRVASRDQTTPRDCVTDGKSAIRWIRQHAHEMGIDPEKIAAGGGSAGGQIAAATATTDRFEEAAEDLSISSRPGALVLFNPVIDNGPGGYGHGWVKEYWEAFSPMHNISEKAPPTIFFLGTKDHLVPVKTAEEFKKRMDEKGVRCELHLYEGQGHGFFNYANREYFAKTVAAMDRFLASLGYLEGEPTITSRGEFGSAQRSP